VPIVVGYVRPIILLPVSLVTDIPTCQLEAILAHELAHVRRHDFVVNLLQTLVETVFFYHPAVWWLSCQMRAEREHCCDDLVVDELGNRLEYGRALLAIEEHRGRGRLTTLALGATDGSLLSRVRRIVGASSQVERLPAVLLGIVLIGISSMLWVTWNLAAEDALPPAVTVNAEVSNGEGANSEDVNAEVVNGEDVNDESLPALDALDAIPKNLPPVGPPPEFGLGQRLQLVQWSHDSKQVYATGSHSKLAMWKRNETGWVPMLANARHHGNSIAASRNSPLLVMGTNDGGGLGRENSAATVRIAIITSLQCLCGRDLVGRQDDCRLRHQWDRASVRSCFTTANCRAWREGRHTHVEPGVFPRWPVACGAGSARASGLVERSRGRAIGRMATPRRRAMLSALVTRWKTIGC
jgi:hypothetical protein